MIDYTLDQANSVLHVSYAGRLQEIFFAALSQAVDPFIERNRGFNGLLLDAVHFPFSQLNEAKIWVASIGAQR